MPTYSYKGYDFDVDHEPTDAEFQQMSVYVDSLPPRQSTQKPSETKSGGFLSDIGTGALQGFQKAASSLGKTGAELAASGEALFTGTKDTETLQKTNQAIEDYFNTQQHKDLGFAGTVAETGANVVPFVANLPAAGVGMMSMYNDMVDGLVKQGVPINEARKSAASNIIAMTALGGGIGVASNKLISNVAGKMLGSGAAFAGGAEAGRQVQNQMLQDYPQAQTEFDPKHAAAQALVGGGLGFAHSTPKKTTNSASDAYTKYMQQEEPAQTPAEANRGVRALLPEFKQNQEPILVTEDGVAVRMRDAENIDTFRNATAEQQRQAQLDQPLEYENVSRPYEPQTYLGEATRVDDGLPYVKETKSANLEALIEEFKQREIDFAYRARAFEEQRPTLSKESTFQEQEKLQQEQQALDEIRKQLFEEQANNQIPEPAQRSVDIENPQERTTYRPNQSVQELPPELRGQQKLFGSFDLERASEDVKQLWNTLDANTRSTILDSLKSGKQASLESTILEYKNEMQPIGQSSFGKSQRGSIGFFGKTPFEKFTDDILKNHPEAKLEDIKAVWEKTQQDGLQKIQEQKQQQKQQSIVQKLNREAQYTNEVWEPQEAIDVFKASADMENRNLFTEQLASSGNLQRDLLNHPVTTWVYNLVNRELNNERAIARNVLDDIRTGLIPSIRKAIMFGKGVFGGKQSERELQQYSRWMVQNEGKDVALPDTFSTDVQQIHARYLEAKKQLLDKMNEVIVAGGGKPITNIPNHFVHYWNGPYRAYIYTKTATGKKLAFYVSEKSMREAKKAVDWISQNVSNIDTEASSKISFVKSDARNRSSMFDHLLSLANETDPVVTEALSNFTAAIQKTQEQHLGEQNRQKFRAGVQGFLGDKPWLDTATNYADYIQTMRDTFDAGYDWVAAQKVRQAMKPVLDAQTNGEISVGKALGIAQKYVDHAFGKDVSTSPVTKFADYIEEASPKFGGGMRRVAKEVKQLMNTVTIPMLLAYRAATLVQGVAQPFAVVLPKMLENRAYTEGNYRDIATSFAQGAMDGLFQLTNMVTGGYFAPVMDHVLRVTNIERSDVSKAVHTALKELDIAQMSLTDSGASKEGGLGRSYFNTTKEALLNAPLSLIEQPTRSWAFSALVRQAVKDGRSIPEAIEIARGAMDTMTNYNPEASSMGLSNLGVVGGEMRGLHTFMINYYTQIARYIKVASEQKNPAPLLTYMGMSIALGGMMGMVGMDVADSLLGVIQTMLRGSPQDSPELQKFNLKQWMMENLPDSLSTGVLSSQTGLGLYGSFSSRVFDPDRTLIENLFPKTTAAMQIGKGLLQTPKLLDSNLPDRERGNILENVLPKAMTQKIRNKYVNKDGVVYDPNVTRAGLPIYKRTDKEQYISEHGLGVRGLGEVLASEEANAQFKGQMNLTKSEKAQLTAFDSALMNVIKAGKSATEFQKQAVGNKYQQLITKWNMEPDTLDKHIEQFAQEAQIPSQQLRDMLRIKNINRKQASKIQDLSGVVKRIQERQQLYGK